MAKYKRKLQREKINAIKNRYSKDSKVTEVSDIDINSLEHVKDFNKKRVGIENRFDSKIADPKRGLQEDFKDKKDFSKVKNKRTVRVNNTEVIKTQDSSKSVIDTKTGESVKASKKLRDKKRLSAQAETKTEVYDPIEKDTDNDGIIDRYDNAFKDSDYFESTYDVEENPVSSSEDKPKASKKKNYTVQKIYTRANPKSKSHSNVITESKHLHDEKLKSMEVSKLFETDDKVANIRNKQSKLYDKVQKKSKYKKGTKNSKLLSSSAALSGLMSDYLSHGSDENASVAATEKGMRLSEKALRTMGNRKTQDPMKKAIRKDKKYERKISVRKSKLDYKESLEKLNLQKSYQDKTALKKFIKRKQMKSQIYAKYQTRFRDRVKKQVKEVVVGARKMVLRNAKKIGGTVIIALLLFMMLFQMTSIVGGGLSTVNQGVMSTTYLSDERVLTEVNQEFSSFEYALQDEMENVEEYHPGYDEYIVNGKELIGHDVHELLSYVTARYGEIKDTADVDAELANIFKAMYKLEYKTEIEIRHYTDDEGNEHSYEYKKLYLTLKKKEMDEYIRAEFAAHEDNLTHYEALLETKGNMELVFGGGSSYGSLDEIVDNPSFQNPGIAFTEEQAKAIFNEAEKHIGKRYVFGGNGPANFDCSSFVCWSFTKSGIKNMPRTTAWLIYKNYTTPISPSEAKAGDIIFFKGTYDSGAPISHVGIYAGNGMMIHAGDPIQYTSINSNYWKKHFYGFGRP